MFKKIASTLLALVLVFAVVPMTVMAGVGDNSYDENEDNDSRSSANLLYSDYTVYGSIYDYDMDFYKFTLTRSAEILFLSTSTSSQVIVGIWDSSEECIAASYPTYNNGYYNNTIIKTLPAGTYYIGIMNSERYYSTTYLFYFECEYATTPHSHSYTSKVTAPTCTTQGYTTYTCSCGDSYKSDYTAASHSYTSKVTAPTCTEQGYTTYTCSSCGDSYKSNYTQATGHTEGKSVKENIINSTCVSEGSYDKVVYCSGCGIRMYTEKVITEINKYEHIFDNFDDMCCNGCGVERAPCESGDVNYDGLINNKDLGLLMQYLNDWDVEINVDAAEVNGDGAVNNKDYGLLMQYLNDWDVELK